MTRDSGTGKYEFEFRPDELLVIQLDVHCDNAASQPRIRWLIENTDISGDDATLRVPPDRSDFWLPYGTVEVGEPRLVFGRGEDPRPAIRPESRTIDAEERETTALPDHLGVELRNQLEDIGTVASDSEQICADPSAFPSFVSDEQVNWRSVEREPVIRDGHTHWKSTEWKPVKWEPDRRVMWYAPPDKNAPERPYQIEEGQLIWREFDMKSSDNVAGQEITEETGAKTTNQTSSV